MFVEKTCEEIASLVGGELIGSCEQKLNGVASLKEAMATDVAFLGNEKYLPQVMPSKAGVTLVPRNWNEPAPAGRAWIKCDDPSGSFTKVVMVFTPPPMVYEPGVDASARIDSTAFLGDKVHIGACVVIGANVRIGAGTVILPGCVLLDGVEIGENCLLYPNCVIRERCLLGNRVILHPGVSIGADGFGYDSGPTGHVKVPQVGIVQIDDDVEIGANSCVDRARFGRTWIQRGTKIDNLVQIGHNVVVGPYCLVVAQAGVSGSSMLGQGVILAGQAGVSGHLKIADGAIIMAQAGISKDIPAKAIMFGTPAKERREYARHEMYLSKIESLVKDVEALKARLEQA